MPTQAVAHLLERQRADEPHHPPIQHASAGLEASEDPLKHEGQQDAGRHLYRAGHQKVLPHGQDGEVEDRQRDVAEGHRGLGPQTCPGRDRAPQQSSAAHQGPRHQQEAMLDLLFGRIVGSVGEGPEPRLESLEALGFVRPRHRV